MACGRRSPCARPRPQAKDNIEGLEALATADLMVMFTRFRALPESQLAPILAYVESGKPLVGLRTTTHAFLYPEGHPRAALNDGFGREIFGQKWITHHGHTSSTDVVIHEDNQAHPILRGVRPFRARSWLYHVAPLHGEANIVLLDGHAVNSERTAKADRVPADAAGRLDATSTRARGCSSPRSDTPPTSSSESMRRLLVNGILWALDRAIPAGGADAAVVGEYVAPESFDLSKVK